MPLGQNFDYAAAAKALGLDSSWYDNEDQMREDVAARWEQASQQSRNQFSRLMSRGRPATRRTVQPQQGINMYDPFTTGGFNAAMIGAASNYNQLGDMANDINDVFQAENQSRVSQGRESRRMAHESNLLQRRLDLERMRLENERYRDQMDAANEIRKLKAAIAAKDPNRTRLRSFKEDPLTGQMRWMEDWEM